MKEATTSIDAAAGDKTVSRRAFLRQAAIAGASLMAAPLLTSASRVAAAGSRGARRPASGSHPNILFICVDEMRAPRWFPDRSVIDPLLPNLTRLRNDSVSFDGHYTASTACTPARGTLLTGLYSHQTGLFKTRVAGQPELNTGFLTWGTALRDCGYRTSWYGKWHLSSEDTLEPYGFDGGTYPSPDGAVQEGTTRDSQTTDQFLLWLEEKADSGPWSTTVSYLNPHDICYSPKYTADYFSKHPAAQIINKLPGNYETPDDLRAHKKPSLHIGFQQFIDDWCGVIPYSGDGFEQGWYAYLNSYLAYQQLVDTQIGRVLDALEKRPDLAENTIVIFTSDHGDYAGSHGLRTKAGAGYEESINVPLYIKDPTGRLAANTDVPRTQLTSSVDIFGLLLTIASGGNSWRSDGRFSHLAHRADLAAILRNPAASGRPYIIHATDETIQGMGSDSSKGAADMRGVPLHVINYRTAGAKYGTYSQWKLGTNQIALEAQETELYDYSTPDGLHELINQADDKPQLAAQLNDSLTNDILPNELRKPLPKAFRSAQEEGYELWFALQDGIPATTPQDLQNITDNPD